VRVMIIDNYDSFTFNLYQYVGEILMASASEFRFDHEVMVKRNDEIDINGIAAFKPDRIIISPGPGTPEDEAYFGVCRDAILELGKSIPLLGVCLGMQGIADCFGGKVVRAAVPMHGKTSQIHHDERGVFKGMPQSLEVMRYHSLIAQAASLPDCLQVTSVVNDNRESIGDLRQAAVQGHEIMGLRHKEFPIQGIQFHPESFATEGAREMLSNFLHQV